MRSASPSHRFRLLLAAVAFAAGLSAAEAAPTFEKESGVRVSTAAPQAVVQSTASLRMYTVRNFQIHSATSADGLSWADESGPRVSTATTPTVEFSSITGADLLPLSGGGFRMIFAATNDAGEFRFYSATSTDGGAWANDGGTRVVVDAGSTFIGSPRLRLEANGDWRLFYLQDRDGGNDLADRRVFTRLSPDEGLTWGAGSTALDREAHSVAISTLTNGLTRLYYTAPLTSETTATQVLSALSTSVGGTAFSLEFGARVSTAAASGALSSLVPVTTTDTFRWRLYYGFVARSTTTSHVFSALTRNPDPQALTPSTVARSDAPVAFTISGEIFSPVPAVRLTRAGETDIPGTAVDRVNDRTITATFDTQNKTLGGWDLVVTNADGAEGTLANALAIDIAGGVVALTDNLLRPRLGIRTRIDVTIFADGPVRLSLFAIDGTPVKTLSDEFRPAGSFMVEWDGTTASGEAAASGVYVLRVDGPKLDATERIVLIR